MDKNKYIYYNFSCMSSLHCAMDWDHQGLGLEVMKRHGYFWWEKFGIAYRFHYKKKIKIFNSVNSVVLKNIKACETNTSLNI